MLQIPGFHLDETLYESDRTLVVRGSLVNDDEADGRGKATPVVIKYLNRSHPTSEELSRFNREYQALAENQYTGIPELCSINKVNNSLMIVVRDENACALSEYANSRALDIVTCLRYLIQIAGTLAVVHKTGYIHKDIKPRNIIVDPARQVCWLIDFGHAIKLDEEYADATDNRVVGSLAYMSPEQTGRMNRTVDSRTDLYSLGVTMYELLCGQTPFEAEDDLGWVHCHIAHAPEPPIEINGEIPQVLSDIVMKLLAKKAESRYQSALGLRHDLTRCLQQIVNTKAIAPFKIGQQDVSSRFQLSQKLYGRERNIEALLSAFKLASNGESQLVLIRGQSGIGKTSVVAEINKPIVGKKGYFITGKFNQFQRSDSYRALFDAFQDLCVQLLIEPEDQLQQWRSDFIATLGSNGKLITDCIPEMEQIIGVQPEITTVNPSEAKNRFKHTMKRFLNVIAQAEHPLVLFLDDLQWSDLSTVELLQEWIQDPQLKYCLIICAYRDNEIHASHPLKHQLEVLTTLKKSVRSIDIKQLHQTDVSALIADTFHTDRANVLSLASLVWDKTGGNPFFVSMFLKRLHEDDHINYDHDTQAWVWNIDAIKALDVTDNLVDLLIEKIEKLPEETRTMLSHAACIGPKFSLATVASVSEKSNIETAKSLWPAVKENLIRPKGDGHKLLVGLNDQASEDEGIVAFKAIDQFVHDRVQQAAYEMIEVPHRGPIHLRIGRVLLEKTNPASMKDQLFTITSQLNLGWKLITNEQEQIRLAQLNWEASRTAKRSSAFDAAYQYAITGLDILLTNKKMITPSETLNKLLRQLHEEAAENAYLNTEFDAMEHHFQQAVDLAVDPIDYYRVYKIKIDSQIAQGRLIEAIEIANVISKILGFSLPNKPGLMRLAYEYLKHKFIFLLTPVRSLKHQAEMTNEKAKAFIEVLSSCSTAAHHTNPLLFLIIILTEINVFKKYGINSKIPFGTAAYGVLSCCKFAIAQGVQYGQLGLEMFDQHDDDNAKARTLFIWNLMLRIWRYPLKDSLPGLMEAHRTATQAGDNEFAMLALWGYSYHAYSLGAPLSQLNDEMNRFRALIIETKQTTTLKWHSLFHQAAANWMGDGENPSLLIGDLCDEKSLYQSFTETNDLTGLGMLGFNKVLLCCYYKQHE